MEFNYKLRNVVSDATTKALIRKIKQHAQSFESEQSLPNWVTIDVRLYLDALDVPGRDIIRITGGPRLVAEYSAWEEQARPMLPTFEQAWQKGSLIIDLDRRFSRSSNALQDLLEAAQPIEASAYAIAQALGKAEGRVAIDWFGIFVSRAPQPQIAFRVQTALVALDGKISVDSPRRTGELLRWES